MAYSSSVCAALGVATDDESCVDGGSGRSEEDNKEYDSDDSDDAAEVRKVLSLIVLRVSVAHAAQVVVIDPLVSSDAFTHLLKLVAA